jgi:hypothetical protein
MDYACIEFKRFLDSEPRRLSPLEEGRDDLLNVLESNGQCIAALRFGAVSLPGEMTERLRELIGHKVAILRWIDGGYRVRDLDLETKNAV